MARSALFTRTALIVLALGALLAAAFGVQLLTARNTADNASAAVGVRITMSVTGQKTGAFKGDDFATGKGSRGLLNVIAYSSEIVSPTDASTGQATGRRIWKPVVVTHLAGGSTPEFLAAAATNENLTKVVINFYHLQGAQEINYLRVTLTNARLTDVRDYTSGADVLEDDSFAFEKITVEDLVAKTIFEDSLFSRT